MLYALMFVMPLVGWGMLSAARYPIVLYGPLQLPAILPHDLTLYAWLPTCYLSGLPALRHVPRPSRGSTVARLIRRDGVFESMASWRRGPSEARRRRVMRRASADVSFHRAQSSGRSRAMARRRPSRSTHQGMRHDEEGSRCSMTTTSLMNSTTTRQPASSAASSDLGARVGWETLLNRAGTTFRKLPKSRKTGSREEALALMLAQPSMIRRPVLESRQADRRLQAGHLREGALLASHRAVSIRGRVEISASPRHPCARSWRDMEGVVGLGDELQRRPVAEPGDRRPQQIELGERVQGSLQEQHGRATAERWSARSPNGLPAGCSGKAKKTRPRTGRARQRLGCEVMRPPNDLPPEQRQPGRAPSRHGDRGVGTGGRSGRFDPRSI